MQFVSEKDRPDLFKTTADEEHRVAVTELTKDAVIYINTDRMNMPLSKWAGLLTHETVHHLGYTDDETRLPDRVGAAIESHFLRIFSNSSLEEFGHPEFHVFTMNTGRPNSYAPAMVSLPLFVYDQHIGPNPRVPICESDEEFKGQNVGSVLWRAVRVRPRQGIVRVKASAIVHSTCENTQTKKQKLVPSLFLTELELQFAPFEIKSSWWTHSSSVKYESLISGNLDGENEAMEINGSIMILSTQHEKAIIQAGDVLKSKITVESLDGFVPKTCHAYLTGVNWAFHNVLDLPAAVVFESCAMKSLGADRYEVNIETLIPKNAQPDFFYTPWIWFSDDSDSRYAVSSRPDVVEVKNPSPSASPRIVDWRVVGLPAVDKILGHAVERSYRTKIDQTFWLEVDVQGTQQNGTEYIEFDILAVDPSGGVVLAPSTVEVQTNKTFIRSFERVQIPGGVRLRYQMFVPSSGKLVLHGIKLLRFYSSTDDFSWVEFDIPKTLSGFIIDDTM